MLNKQYLAVICGKPDDECKELVDYLEKTVDHTAKVCGDGTGKKSILRYKILNSILTEELWPDAAGEVCKELSLAEIQLMTGRFHQIRCQMSHAGFPLVADYKYGSAVSIALSGKLGVRNVALCAHSIAFKHPVTGKEMHFTRNPRGVIFSHFSF